MNKPSYHRLPGAGFAARRHFTGAYLGLALIMVSLSGCFHTLKETTINTRGALVSATDSFGDSARQVIYPEQNWSPEESLWFYTATQGSHLMPYDLFLHLEMPDSRQLFRSAENMDRLRYLPQRASPDNPDGLPVGWVKDIYAGKAYVGLNCAACHTSQIHYQGTAIRIDGGAAQADMELMLLDLSKALDASLTTPEKFERLAKKVLADNYPEKREEFRLQLTETAQKIRAYNQTNEPRHGDQYVPYGYARLDAFGRIYNRILNHLTPDDQANANPANAPVSYPYLWDTPQHDFVQWNGVGDNEAEGPLVRNVGEALGVFATFDLHKKPQDPGFSSSVAVRQLVKMEKQLQHLWSPQWRELAGRKALPPIDEALAKQGQALFTSYQCHSCHTDITRTDPDRRVITQFSSLPVVGTDPIMAVNALKYTGKSGIFEGISINPADPAAQRFGAMTPVLPALSLATEGVIRAPGQGNDNAWLGEKDIAEAIAQNPIKQTERHLDFTRVNKKDPRTLAAYKARPLNGVWTSAPYLHNGSVPSLYDLLLPSCSDGDIASGKECRPNRFTLGTRELDPVKVGFVLRDPAKFPGLFVFDTGLPGNSNKGHEFTAGVTPVFILDANGEPQRDAQGKPLMRQLPPMDREQRLALVEYLKTL